MRQEQSGKRNVAWFTLAECVSRGEKERALGVYRLLSHSLDDSAVIAQLEGDLLWAFNDTTALEKYYVAATRYQHDGRYREALTVLEHSRTLLPTSRYCLERLIDLALIIHSEERLIEYVHEYIDRVDDQESYIFAHAALEKAESIDLKKQFFLLKIALMLRVSVLDVIPKSSVLPLLQEVAQACLLSSDERQLQRLIITLEQNSSLYHQQLLDYLADHR
jgi:hypothetical protein